jgi:malate dehydrogenase (oxaloacetate-decarboxylating)(NADP+)
MEMDSYREKLSIRIGTGRETMRGMIIKAAKENLRVVFSEGASETTLRACSILLEEGMARPILVGSEEEIKWVMARLDLDLGGVEIIDPLRSPRFDNYVDEYFSLRNRRGVMHAEAVKRVRKRDYFAALMVHAGDADMLFAGVSTHYADSLRTILEVIGPAPGVSRVSSHHIVLLPKSIYLLADCAVNIDPTAEELAEIALLTASKASTLGMEPKVAMLSFSNFGSVSHPLARKVRRATEIAKERAPELLIDGEMQLVTAVREDIRQKYFPFSELRDNANILIFPELQSGNLALNLLQYIGEAVSVGPILMGTRLPAHLRQYGATVDEIVNLAAVGIVEAAALKKVE